MSSTAISTNNMPTYPTLPLDPRTEVNVEVAFAPNLYQQNEGYVSRKSRSYRHIPKANLNFSTYLDNIILVTDFLHGRQGYKPFIFLQDGKLYICQEWTVTYVEENKGTLQAQFLRYTNEN